VGGVWGGTGQSSSVVAPVQKLQCSTATQVTSQYNMVQYSMAWNHIMQHLIPYCHMEQYNHRMTNHSTAQYNVV
jgi:hypothetical protein